MDRGCESGPDSVEVSSWAFPVTGGGLPEYLRPRKGRRSTWRSVRVPLRREAVEHDRPFDSIPDGSDPLAGAPAVLRGAGCTEREWLLLRPRRHESQELRSMSGRFKAPDVKRSASQRGLVTLAWAAAMLVSSSCAGWAETVDSTLWVTDGIVSSVAR